MTGRARIDLDDNGIAEPESVLFDMGISTVELERLADLYPESSTTAPISVWRVPLPHFTPWDCNYPYDLADDAEYPPAPIPTKTLTEDQPTECMGTILQCENQVVAEEVPIIGSRYALRFQSDRVPAYREALRAQIPLTRDQLSPPGTLAETTLVVEVAGRRFEYLDPVTTISPAGSNRRVFEFTDWDGTDFAGRRIRTPQPVSVELCYKYMALPAVSGAPRNIDALSNPQNSFGGTASGVLYTSRVEGLRSEGAARLCRQVDTEIALGPLSNRELEGLGGLGFSARAHLTPDEVLFGDGTRTGVETAGGDAIADTVIGLAVEDAPFSARQDPRNTTVTDLALAFIPSSARVIPWQKDKVFVDLGYVYSTSTPRGGVYLADLAAGTFTEVVVPEAVFPGFRHYQASVNRHDGSLVFTPTRALANTKTSAVAAFSFDLDTRDITPLLWRDPSSAPTAADCEALDGMPARDFNVRRLVDGTSTHDGVGHAAVDFTGRTFFYEPVCRRIVMIDHDGTLRVFAGGGAVNPDLATEGTFLRDLDFTWDETWVDFGVSVDGLLMDGGHSSPFRYPALLGWDGSVRYLFPVSGSPPAPTGSRPLSPAVNGSPVGLLSPPSTHNLSGDPSGWIYFMGVRSYDRYLCGLSPDGRLYVLGGGGEADPPFANIPGLELQVPADAGPSIGTGQLFVTDNFSVGNKRLHRLDVSNSLRSLTLFRGSTGVARFADGRHVATIDPLTGAPTATFEYWPDGRLRRLVDPHGEVVLQADYGATQVDLYSGPALDQHTRVKLDVNGWASEVVYPDDPSLASVSFDYDSDYPGTGRLLKIVDRSGLEHRLEFDDAGLVESDATYEPGGTTPLSSWTLVPHRRDHLGTNDDGVEYFSRQRTVTVTSLAGRARTFEMESRTDGRASHTIDPPHRPAYSTLGARWSSTTDLPNGATIATTWRPDPIVGNSSRVPSTTTLTLPLSRVSYQVVHGYAVDHGIEAGERVSSGTWTTTSAAGQSTVSLSALPGDRSQVDATTPAGRRTRLELDEHGRPSRVDVLDGSGVRPVDGSGAQRYASTFVQYDGNRVSSVISAPVDPSGQPDLSDASRVRRVDLTYVPTGSPNEGWLQTSSVPTASGPLTTTVNARDYAGRPTDVQTGTAQLGTGYDDEGRLNRVTPPGRADHDMSYSHHQRLASYEPPAYSELGDGAPPFTETPTTAAPGPDVGEIDYLVLPGSVGTIDYTYEPTTGRLDGVDLPGFVEDIDLSYAGLATGAPTDNGQLRRSTMPQTAGTPAIANEWDYDGPWRLEERTAGGTLPQTPWAVTATPGANGMLWTDTLEVATMSDSYTVDYDYDADGLVTQAGPMLLVPDPVTGALTAACVGSTTTTGTDCDGDVKTSIVHDFFGAPDTITTTWGEGPTEQTFALDLGYDGAGRIESIEEGTLTKTFSYDDVGRLTDVHKGATRTHHYEYDLNGNRIAWDIPGYSTCTPAPGTPCAVVDEQDRLLRYGTTEYTYDDAGRLETKTEGADVTTYHYDALGNLRSVDLPDGTEISYAIDARGRRVGRYVDPDGAGGAARAADRFWIYKDGLNPIAQLKGSGEIEMVFIYAEQAHVPSVVAVANDSGGFVHHRVVTDQVGSVRYLIDTSDSSISFAASYHPFGGIIAGTEQGPLAGAFPFRFAGGLWDADTGLVRFGARDYDPRVGRWTAKDPLLFVGRSSNLYLYVNGDPVMLVDPDGRFFVVASLLVGAAVLSGVTNGISESANGGTFWGGFARGATGGLVGGAVTALLAPVNPAAAGAAGSATGSAVTTLLNEFFSDEGIDPDTAKNVAVSGVCGGVIGFATGGLLGSRMGSNSMSTAGDEGAELVEGLIGNYVGNGWSTGLQSLTGLKDGI